MSQQPPNTQQPQWPMQQSPYTQQPQWPSQQSQYTQQTQWVPQQSPYTQQSEWVPQQPAYAQQTQWPSQQPSYTEQSQWVPQQPAYAQQTQWVPQQPPNTQQPQWGWQDQPQPGQFQPQPPSEYGSPQSKQSGQKPWYKNRGVIIGLLCSILVVVLVLGYVGYGVSTLLGHKSASTSVATPIPSVQLTASGLTATPSLAPTTTPTHVASPTATPTVVAVVPTQATTPAPTQAPKPTPTPKLQPTTVQVSVTNSGFSPANITIAVGSTVVWTNNGSIPHTATDSGKFDSGELIVGATYQYTFTTPGTYNYICSYHPSMVGTITVQ